MMSYLKLWGHFIISISCDGCMSCCERSVNVSGLPRSDHPLPDFSRSGHVTGFFRLFLNLILFKGFYAHCELPSCLCQHPNQVRVDHRLCTANVLYKYNQRLLITCTHYTIFAKQDRCHSDDIIVSWLLLINFRSEQHPEY